jgi:hypothetical protein
LIYDGGGSGGGGGCVQSRSDIIGLHFFYGHGGDGGRDPPLEFSFDFLAQKLEEFYRGREGEEVDYRGKASRRQLSQVPASVLHTFSPQSSVANTGRS